MAYKQKNNPFKLQATAAPKKVKVFGGKATVDVSTEAGRKILEEIKRIPTVRSSDAGRVTKRSAVNKVKKILSKGKSSKLLTLGARASAILAMFDPMSAGKGSTTLDKDKYDLMKNIKD